MRTLKNWAHFVLIIPCSTFVAIGSCMVNVQKFEHFSISLVKLNVGFQDWNSQNAHQNSKQGRPLSDCFFESTLIWVRDVCLGLFGRRLD